MLAYAVITAAEGILAEKGAASGVPGSGIEPRVGAGPLTIGPSTGFSVVGLAKASTHKPRTARPIARARRATWHRVVNGVVMRSRRGSSGEAERPRSWC